MRQKGKVYTEDECAAIIEHIEAKAAGRFFRMVKEMDERNMRGIATPHQPPQPGHWFRPVYNFFYGLNFRGRRFIAPFDKVHPGRQEWWTLSDRWVGPWVELKAHDLTHHFGNDDYPFDNKADRRGLQWTRGSWCLGDIADEIRNDHLLSSDGVHLWMWCLLPQKYDRSVCHFAMLRQFRQLIHQPKYAGIFQGYSAAQVLDMVYTFHVGDRLEPFTYDNDRQTRKRAFEKVGMCAA